MKAVASDRSWGHKEGHSWAHSEWDTEREGAWNPGNKALEDERTYTKLHSGRWGNICRE